MTIEPRGQVDAARAEWNDAMYAEHPTPYVRGLSRQIELARVRMVIDLARITPDDAVLEIGCEAGGLLVAVPPTRRLVGIDISIRALRDAELRLRGGHVELYHVDAERGLPFRPGEFDVVLCSEMLEHTKDPATVLRHIRALCTPTTRVVLSVPIESRKLRAKALLRRFGLLRVIAGDVEEHQSEWHVHAFSPAMLNRLLDGSFDIVARRTTWFVHDVVLLRPHE